jgi:oligopeptide transport system permease protein
MPRRELWTRVAGGAALAFVVWMFVHRPYGPLLTLALTLSVWALASRFFPLLALRRFLWALPLFALLIFVAIQLMFLAPGDPFASEKNAPEAVRKQQQANYGVLDRSFVGGARFFGRYVDRLVNEGYMGPAIKVEGQSVAQVLLPAFPVSMSLGLLALIIATALGLALGIRAGLKPNSFADASSMAFALIGISLPTFVIGALLMIVFALKLGWLPVAGWGGYRHLVLPAITLALPYAAYIARLARGGTIEVMSQDFVRTARAKGLSEGEVVMKHAFRGAITPVVSYLGPAASGILMGSFVVETLFGIPGLGQWFVKSAINRDYYVVLGTMLLDASVVVLFNLVVDLAYAWIDPRVRDSA